jgi:predicted permease
MNPGTEQTSRSLMFDDMSRDVRYALRMLRRSPGFTLTAVLIIALGIGATTAIFSVVYATVLRPLPYPHPEQLVSIQDDLPGNKSDDVGMSPPEWLDLQRSGVFEHISPAFFDMDNLTGASQPALVRILAVAPNYFTLLGIKPQLGNIFNPNDPTRGFNLQVVISDGLWKRAFGSDPNTVGKTIQLDGDSYRIIGVMPEGFYVPGRTTDERNVEVWPAAGYVGTPFPDPPSRSFHFPAAIGRLKSGVTLAEAQSRVDALVASLKQQFPLDYPAKSGWRVRLVPLKETMVGQVRQSLFLLLGGVGLVLLIGCVNVANLLLARASARGREMAVRQAMGAARSRLMRQLLTESLFLSLLGGALGLVILFFTKDFLLQLVPESVPRLNNITISWSILLFAFAASLIAGVIFGLAPVFHAGRVNLVHALKQQGRSSSGSGEQSRTRRILVVTEFALSLVLMIAAGLLVRSFWDLLNVQLGFNPKKVVVVRTRLPYPNDPKADNYGTISQQGQFFQEILRRVRALPGVEQAALGNSTSVPLNHTQRDANLVPLILEGMAPYQAPLVNASIVTPEYFPVLGFTLQRGRLFNEADNEQMPMAVVVNEALAHTYWPQQDAIGQHLKLSPRAASFATVVGVVANARTESIDNTKVPQVYASMYQRREKHLAIFLRGSLDISAVPAQVRQQVQAVDQSLPVFRAETLTQSVSSSLAERRFSMEMVALFALTALLLASLGIYGVISYIVNERTHEIGIQLALGAQRGRIIKMVVREGLSLAITGAAVGLVGALIVSHLMSGLLYGVRPTDPLTFIGVTVVLTGVALAACYLPARRAVRIDPIEALRSN